MAWNPNPKVADCREVARKWRKQQVIILAVDTRAGTLEYASFGETKQLCSEARRLADAAYAAVMKEYGKSVTEVDRAMVEALEIIAHLPGVDSYVTAVALDALKSKTK